MPLANIDKCRPLTSESKGGFKQMSSVDNPSLKKAKEIVGLVPRPSPIFTSCIRSIRTAEDGVNDTADQTLREFSVHSSAFLIGVSPTLKSVFYYAAQDLYKESIPSLDKLTPKSLLLLFNSNEITAILSLTYYYRQLKKICDQSEFERLSSKMLRHMEIGALIGNTVQHIGRGYGMLLGGLRYAAVGLLMLKDLKLYQEYRRRLTKSDLLFDLEWEKNAWGCSHLEIASVMAQALGFGRIISMGMAADNAHKTPTEGLPKDYEERLMCWRVATHLTESFHNTGGMSEITDEKSELFLPQEELEFIKRQVWSILRDGTNYSWLTKTLEDLPAEVLTPLEISESKEDMDALAEKSGE